MSSKSTAAAAAVLGLVVVGAVVSRPSGTAKSKKGKSRPKTSGKPKGGWADGDAPRRIREIAAQIEDRTGWWGLGDFLVAVAWTESRGNSNICNTDESGYCAKNSARGWFQGRPKSFLVKQFEFLKDANPDIILDERWAVVLAAWYAYRLRGFRFAGQVIDWLAIRRGWALPSRVKDVDEEHQRSVETRERFEAGVYKAGLDENFMYEPAFPKGFDWPGIEGLLEAVGIEQPYGVAGVDWEGPIDAGLIQIAAAPGRRATAERSAA